MSELALFINGWSSSVDMNFHTNFILLRSKNEVDSGANVKLSSNSKEKRWHILEKC